MTEQLFLYESEQAAAAGHVALQWRCDGSHDPTRMVLVHEMDISIAGSTVARRLSFVVQPPGDAWPVIVVMFRRGNAVFLGTGELSDRSARDFDDFGVAILRSDVGTTLGEDAATVSERLCTAMDLCPPEDPAACPTDEPWPLPSARTEDPTDGPTAAIVPSANRTHDRWASPDSRPMTVLTESPTPGPELTPGPTPSSTVTVPVTNCTAMLLVPTTTP